MPGFTHLQHGQPILFSHHIMAYFEMFQRDVDRFNFCQEHVNVSPLGAGALAGVTYDIDRESVARKLEFKGVTANSIDAVSDRDFILEYEAAAAICIMHLSRMAEELILWSSSEFNFIDIDEAYCTSSSIMPQKKNADVLELIRGKSGRVYGSLVGLLTVMKGLPLAYNRDMQEDKESLFDVVDTLSACVEMATGIIGSLKVNRERMYFAAGQNYTLATDLADYLVSKGVAFRKAHSIVSNLVKYAQENEKDFKDLKLTEFRKFSGYFDKDVYSISLENSVASRNITGATAKNQVKKSIRLAEKILASQITEKTIRSQK
jgi:argininosuccinate lyase